MICNWPKCASSWSCVIITLAFWTTCVIVIWPLNAMVRAKKYWMSPEKMEDSSTLSRVQTTDSGLMIYVHLRKNPHLGAGGPLDCTGKRPHRTPTHPHPPTPNYHNNHKNKNLRKNRKVSMAKTAAAQLAGSALLKGWLMCRRAEGAYSIPTNQGNVATIRLWTSSCKVVGNQHYGLGETVLKGECGDPSPSVPSLSCYMTEE